MLQIPTFFAFAIGLRQRGSHLPNLGFQGGNINVQGATGKSRNILAMIYLTGIPHSLVHAGGLYFWRG